MDDFLFSIFLVSIYNNCNLRSSQILQRRLTNSIITFDKPAHLSNTIFCTLELSYKLNKQMQCCLTGDSLYYVVLLYYIPFSNLITGSLYLGLKLVTRYKAKLPAYAMTSM